MVRKYDGLVEFCEVARTTREYSYSYETGEWVGGISYLDAISKTLNGDISYVDKAEELMEKLDANVELPKASWQPSMYGAYPIVPEYLAGSPTSMRHRVECESDSSSIAIYVSTKCSAMMSAEEMLQRGTAILALVMKMQQIRPVELYLLAETHGQSDGELLQVIRIESKPVDISVAAFVLCHVGFARHLTYSVARKVDSFNGSWPKMYGGGGEVWEHRVRQTLGMGKDDLYIGAARSWDELIQHPVEWVNTQVQRFVGEREE